MSTRLTISPQDVLRGKLVIPGWHRCKVTDVVAQNAKTDGSAGVNVSLSILEGPFVGVPLQRYFSEKAPGFAQNYLKAFGANVDEVVSSGKAKTFELADTKGKDVMVYVKNDKSPKGAMVNVAEDFRPVGGG